MDCPICYETISKETGQVTTSCGHSFHFKCLNAWYWQQMQNEEAKESCPCCRKEPCEFERASTVEESEVESTAFDTEEELDQEQEDRGWVRVGPGRWIIPNNSEHRLQILATIAEEERKRNELHIPAYDGEAHALWILRNFFEVPFEGIETREEVSSFDRPRNMRIRSRPLSRIYTSQLNKMAGYETD